MAAAVAATTAEMSTTRVSAATIRGHVCVPTTATAGFTATTTRRGPLTTTTSRRVIPAFAA
jgi:hypothetical protein